MSALTVRELLAELQPLKQDKEILFHDVEILLGTCLVLDKTQLLLAKDREISTEEKNAFDEQLLRYRAGEPLAYILGYADFYESRFKVTPDVLVPRSDTETLVEVARELADVECIADLGSGSGCVGLSLLKLYRDAELWAYDKSEPAIEVTVDNAKAHGLFERLHTRAMDPRDDEPHQYFDLIVSNPPYIDLNDTRVTKSVRDYEPHLALYAEDNGAYYFRHWSKWAYSQLTPGGWLVYEFGQNQANIVRQALQSVGFEDINIYKDLSGENRVAKAVKG